MQFPLVTVGVASYNNATYLAATLDSIAQQDYPNWELIIVDDSSSDNSAVIASNWLEAHPNVKGKLFALTSNEGVCRVFNRVVKESAGEFLSIIGSDDLYLPGKLSLQVEAFSKLSAKYGLVYSDITNIDENGLPLYNAAPVLAQHSKPEGDVYLEVLTGNFIPAMGQLMRMCVFEEIGLFDEQLAYEDWDMWLRLTQKFQVKYVPGIVARYRLHSRSASEARKRQLADASLLLLSKHLGQGPITDRIIAGHFARYVETLAWLDSPDATRWLRHTLALQPQARTLVLLALTSTGLTLPRLHRWYRRLWPVKK